MSEELLGKRVAVLCGGWSSEREVSLSSGRECARGLSEAGFAEIDLLDVAEPGFVKTIATGGYDVAFVALHGSFGEDGCMQGLLEILGIPYTFSNVLASAVTADKAVTKDIYRAHGIPTPKALCLLRGEAYEAADVVEQLGLPLFVKPVANGSSYGISKVEREDELDAALTRAFELDTRVLVEAAVIGTEITVPVLGNDHPEALPPIEIRVDSGFYDLDAKYDDPAKHHVIPPELPSEVVAQAQELACRAHVALGCSGASRSDIIVAGDGVPYMLETNVVPGMTAASLFPDSARRAGRSFPELCRELVELALERGVRSKGCAGEGAC